jgi:hypothetical protein
MSSLSSCRQDLAVISGSTNAHVGAATTSDLGTSSSLHDGTFPLNPLANKRYQSIVVDSMN